MDARTARPDPVAGEGARTGWSIVVDEASGAALLESELAGWRAPGGALEGALVGRVHLPAARCPHGIGGPTPVALRLVTDIRALGANLAARSPGAATLALR
jgi:hypothetical protein